MAVDNLTLDYDTRATSWYSEMCVVAGAVSSIVSPVVPESTVS